MNRSKNLTNKSNLMQTINNLTKRTAISPTKQISEKPNEESTTKKPPCAFSLLHMKNSADLKENLGVVSAKDLPLQM